MKASDFIKNIQDKIDEHGDWEIVDHNRMKVDKIWADEESELFEID